MRVHALWVVSCFLLAHGELAIAVDNNGMPGIEIPSLDDGAAASSGTAALEGLQIEIADAFSAPLTLTQNVVAIPFPVKLDNSAAAKTTLLTPPIQQTKSYDYVYSQPPFSTQKPPGYMNLSEWSRAMVVPTVPNPQSPQTLDTIQKMLSTPLPNMKSTSFLESPPGAKPPATSVPWQ